MEKSGGDNDDEICDGGSCYIEERHDLVKDHFTRFSNEVNPLFFVNDSVGDNESITKFKLCQQILDSAHN